MTHQALVEWLLTAGFLHELLSIWDAADAGGSGAHRTTGSVLSHLLFAERGQDGLRRGPHLSAATPTCV